MSEVLWARGVRNMVSKDSAKNRVTEVAQLGTLRTTKNEFILLSRRGNLGGWKNAVGHVISKKTRNDAIESLADGRVFHVTKAELRRAAAIA